MIYYIYYNEKNEWLISEENIPCLDQNTKFEDLDI